MTAVPEDTWGPTQVGGRTRRGWRKPLAIAGVVLGIVVAVVGGLALRLYQVAEDNLTRVSLPALADQPTEPSSPLNVLVVGSDSRQGLTEEEIREYNLGDFEGQRGDTVILVSITPDRSAASVVSFPRDLIVEDDGREVKLTETFMGGTDNVLEVIQDETGVPIHHYVEVSIPGFISLVDAVGGVEICFDRPLRDRKAGADFEEGCHDLTPAESLAFVRSRSTERGDFDRIDRQQEFLKALLDRLVATRTLVDVPRLFSVVERVSRNVTTDVGLGVGEMRTLAQELRGLASGQIPMVTVPSYAAEGDNGGAVVYPYDPGAEALYATLRRGEVLEPRGPKDQVQDTNVAVFAGEGAAREAELVQRTLFWSSFRSYVAGPSSEPVRRTTVYSLPDHQDEADWVGAILGARVRPLPDDRTAPGNADVVVEVSERTLDADGAGDGPGSDPADTTTGDGS